MNGKIIIFAEAQVSISQDSSVTIVTRLRAERLVNRGSIAGSSKTFLQSLQTFSGTHPVRWSVGSGG